MKNCVTPKQYSCSQAKVMSCLRERKSRRQILNLKYIFGTEAHKSKSAFSWSLAKIHQHTFPRFSCSRGGPLLFLHLHTFSNTQIPFFFTILPPAASVFFGVFWGWTNRVPFCDQVLAGVPTLQEIQPVHVCEWCVGAHRPGWMSNLIQWVASLPAAGELELDNL